MISLSHVKWGAGRFTLSVDLTLSKRVTGIFGCSGSGKTTLLELISGLRRPLSGEIRVGDLTVASPRAWVAPEYRRIGYVPQDAALFPHLSVLQNLRFGLPPADGGTRQFEEAPIVDLLGLGPLLSARIAGLSGGERQRIALGRALLSQPRLLLLDEPFASVDVERREALIPYFQRLRDAFSLPMIHVSHSADELARLCDEVIVLHEGRVIDRGASSQVFVAETVTRFRRKIG